MIAERVGRSLPWVLAVVGIALGVSSQLRAERRLASLEATLRVVLEERALDAPSARPAVEAAATQAALAPADLSALLETCRLQAEDSIVRPPAPEPAREATAFDAAADAARRAAETLLAAAVERGRWQDVDRREMTALLAQLPAADVARIGSALADAVNRGQVHLDDPMLF